MLCMGAALLARITDGTYVDPQSGASHSGTAAVEAAKREALEFAQTADEESRIRRAFPGWRELGVDA